jgi:hypothetical protein
VGVSTRDGAQEPEPGDGNDDQPPFLGCPFVRGNLAELGKENRKAARDRLRDGTEIRIVHGAWVFRGALKSLRKAIVRVRRFM